jgi:hypothetical protein
MQQKPENTKRPKLPSFLQKGEVVAQQIRTGSIKRDVPAFLHSPVVPKNEPVSQHEQDKNLLFKEVIDISDESRPTSIIKSKAKSPVKNDLLRPGNLLQPTPSQQL